MIAIDLSKQQALDADPKAIQQINFTANLNRAVNTRFYFILEEAKETVFELAMCRGELSAVIARLMSKSMLSGRGSEESKKCPPPSPAVP